MNQPDHAGLALLRELLAVPAPSGREEKLGALVRRKIEAMGFSPATDGAGNLTVRLPGRDATAGEAILAAHLDELAVLVTAVEPDGSLRVSRSGALYPYKIGERPVTIVGDGAEVTGLLSFGSTHGGAGERMGQRWDDLRIVTGLSPDQLTEHGVRVGSTALPLTDHRGPVLFGDSADPCVAAWTLDDRLGVVALLQMLETISREDLQPPRPLTVAFTIHEEGGCHGAKVLAHRLQPELFIAVDGCPILPESGLANDGRPATWSHDDVGHLDQRFIPVLAAAARAAGTQLQIAAFPSGARSDASAVYNVGGAPRVGIIGHARQNSHGYEYTPLSSFNNLHATLVELVRAQW